MRATRFLHYFNKAGPGLWNITVTENEVLCHVEGVSCQPIR